MTDKHGKKLSNQYAQIGSPQREYFRMNGHYEVLHHYGDTMEIEVAGEPVFIQSRYNLLIDNIDAIYLQVTEK